MEHVIEKFKQGVDYHFTEQIINEINQDKNKSNINMNSLNKENEKNNNDTNKNKKEEEKNIEEKEKIESMYLYKQGGLIGFSHCDKIIIQKYIEDPLLYRERKCDMRI